MLGTDQSAEGVSFFTSQSITDKDPPLTLSSDANLLASAGWTGQRRYDPELSPSLSLSLSVLCCRVLASLSLFFSLSFLFLFLPHTHTHAHTHTCTHTDAHTYTHRVHDTCWLIFLSFIQQKQPIRNPDKRQTVTSLCP